MVGVCGSASVSVRGRTSAQSYSGTPDCDLVSYISFFFNDTATTKIYTRPYTLSLHDALPICVPEEAAVPRLDEHVPGQRDRGEEEDAPPRNPRRDGPLARQPEEHGDDDQRRQRAHDVLRDRRETERRV